jgi:hypothetical protein
MHVWTQNIPKKRVNIYFKVCGTPERIGGKKVSKKSKTIVRANLIFVRFLVIWHFSDTYAHA